MQKVRMDFRPAVIPEWEAEVALTGCLGTRLMKSAPPPVEEFFRAVDICLPQEIEQRFLTGFDKNQNTPLQVPLLADSGAYDYYLIEVPVTILVPEDRSLIWFGLALELKASFADGAEAKALPYSLFPTTEWKEKDWDMGEMSLDTAKALKALVPGLDKIADALSFKIKFPVQWKSRRPMIQSTNRLHNPAKWIVKDEAIQNGFNAYAVIQAPKDSTVRVEACLQAVIKKDGLFAPTETVPASRLSYTLRRG